MKNSSNYELPLIDYKDNYQINSCSQELKIFISDLLNLIIPMGIIFGLLFCLIYFFSEY